MNGAREFFATPRLVVFAGLGALAGSRGGFADALVGDLDGVGHFLGRGSRERAVEACDVDAAIAHFGVDGGVHGRQ